MKLLLFGNQGSSHLLDVGKRLDRAGLPFDCVCHGRRLSDVSRALSLSAPSLPMLILVAAMSSVESFGELSEKGFLQHVTEFYDRGSAGRLQQVVTSLGVATGWQVVCLPLAVGVTAAFGNGMSEAVSAFAGYSGEFERTRDWRWNHRC